MFKMPFDCKCFNKDQKVFIQEMGGYMSAKVSGRLRSNGEYVSSWVSWDGGKDIPDISVIDVETIFANLVGLELVGVGHVD